jgi:hypothetical protein
MIGKTFLGKIFLAVFCIGIFAFCAENASAQVDQVMVSRQKARTTIKPKAKPVAKKVDYNKRITITRVEKKSRKNYKKTTSKKTTAKKTVVKVSVLPLAVQMRLLTLDETGKETEVDPYSKFTTSDRLRLSLKSNQRGYLYVIHQKAPDVDGEIIFPTQLVNNGSNYIAANKEYILPSNCPKNVLPNPIDCSLTLASPDDAPQEYFTVIFTRDSLVDLPNDVRNKRVSLQNLLSAGKIPFTTLIDLIEESGQDLVVQPGDTPAAMRIINKNVKDNEEIIETFILDKAK